MNKEKQIEEMANIIALKAFEQAHLINGDENLADIVATDLYTKGYRKASDVAREIFEEIARVGGTSYGDITLNPWDIAELKKKYTESEKDNG